METLCFYGVFLFLRVSLAKSRLYRGRKRKDEEQAQETGTHFRILPALLCGSVGKIACWEVSQTLGMERSVKAWTDEKEQYKSSSE